MSEDIMAKDNVISLVAKRKQAEQLVEDARDVFRLQAAAISNLARNVNGDYTKAVKILLNTTGHVIVCGMGKSGLIGQKMAATFASTGTPSFLYIPPKRFMGIWE